MQARTLLTPFSNPPRTQNSGHSPASATTCLPATNLPFACDGSWPISVSRQPRVSVRQSHLEIDPVPRHRVHDEDHAHHGERHDRPTPQAALLPSRTQRPDRGRMQSLRRVSGRRATRTRHQCQHRSSLDARASGLPVANAPERVRGVESYAMGWTPPPAVERTCHSGGVINLNREGRPP